jgi:hypothetical protein
MRTHHLWGLMENKPVKKFNNQKNGSNTFSIKEVFKDA